MRDELIDWADHADVLDSGALIDHLTSSGLNTEVEHVLAAAPVPLPEFAASATMPAEAETGWWHIFGLLSLERLREEVSLARLAFTQDPTPDTQRRLTALCEALDRVVSGEPDGVGQAA